MNKTILFTITAILFLSSCVRQPAVEQKPLTSLSKEIKEIRPGILEGYLAEDEYPNSLELLPPPPDEGTAAFQLDLEIAAMYVAMKDEARKEQAVKDNELHFPEAADAFNIVLDVVISEEITPMLYMILRRTLADAGLATYAAKNHYNRMRPFMINETPSCIPEGEEELRGDGSYPSGHTAIGWAWALILVEVFPDKTDVILQRGKEFGKSRNVCNVHWHSDVVTGRMIGAGTVAKLHSNEDFLIDMAVAKEEILALKN